MRETTLNLIKRRIAGTEVWVETIVTVGDALDAIPNSIRQVCVPFEP